MADVYDYVIPDGVITPDADVIQADVIAEYQTAFGADLIVTPETPQGVLIATETSARVAVADNNATLANQINPNIAGGVYLDALMQLTGAQRIPGTPSIVYATLTGVAGTSIPAGAQASETGSGNANLFQLVATTVIPSGGSIANVEFQSVALGAIPANAGTLTTIVSNILGWETITNPAAAVQGTPVQSDIAARFLRASSLAAQGSSLAGAIISALNLTPGVTSLSFQENVQATTQVINGVSMVSHSLYTCVAGTATNLAIATTLTNKKSGGCAYNNGLGIPVSQAVVNQYSHQSINVLFDRPSIVEIQVVIDVVPVTNTSNLSSSVNAAVLAYFNGDPTTGWPGLGVGTPVSPFQIASYVNSVVPGIFVNEVQIGIESFTQIGTLASGMNTVTGMTYNSAISTGIAVTDPLSYLPAGTTVASLVGSTGLTLNHNATATATEILTFFPTPALQTTEIPIAVWQQAQTVSGYITVNIP